MFVRIVRFCPSVIWGLNFRCYLPRTLDGKHSTDFKSNRILLTSVQTIYGILDIFLFSFISVFHYGKRDFFWTFRWKQTKCLLRQRRLRFLPFASYSFTFFSLLVYVVIAINASSMFCVLYVCMYLCAFDFWFFYVAVVQFLNIYAAYYSIFNMYLPVVCK